ncbi:hypothetical protein F2Q69_00058866 [Brassica cretica]|uniref:Uncharacterized protein n=1 Tax=Brassica cretica TaxID=69181 RepID=A0A8S9RQ84_BRACR|nr:hypothetical protein F2Q69_00058866 [Brassica cretica]
MSGHVDTAIPYVFSIGRLWYRPRFRFPESLADLGEGERSWETPLSLLRLMLPYQARAPSRCPPRHNWEIHACPGVRCFQRRHGENLSPESMLLVARCIKGVILVSEGKILRFELAELPGALLQMLRVFVEFFLKDLEVRGQLGIGIFPTSMGDPGTGPGKLHSGEPGVPSSRDPGNRGSFQRGSRGQCPAWSLEHEHFTLYATRSSLSSKWNSNKPTQNYHKFQVEFTQAPTHSVLGEKQLVDWRGLGQNPRDDLTGLDWTDLDLDRTSASPFRN